jgi:hypothetical protein
LQQQVSGSGQHWMAKHYYSCKKSWEHITQCWDLGNNNSKREFESPSVLLKNKRNSKVNYIKVAIQECNHR